MTETPGFHLRRRLTQALVAHPYEAQYHGVTWLQQVQGFRMSETKGLQSSRPLIVALMCTLKEHRIAAIIRSQGLRDRGTRGLWLDRLTASLLVYYQVQSFTQEEAVGRPQGRCHAAATPAVLGWRLVGGAQGAGVTQVAGGGALVEWAPGGG
eukprot:9180-Pelagomonas_calceolata.AAC.2